METTKIHPAEEIDATIGYWYKKDGKEFVLMYGKDEPGNEVYRCEKVAIAYSGLLTQEFELHRHGRPDLVQKWFSNKGKDLRKAGAIQEFADYCLIESELFTTEDLNKLVNDSAFVKKFVDNFNAGLINAV